jgi:5-methylcytosine-specific restriction endonuclease McrA
VPSGVYPRTEKHIEIYRKSHLGKIPWNKGRKGFPAFHNKGFQVGQKNHTQKHSEESKKKSSESIKAAWASGKYKNRPPISRETKDKIRQSVRKVVRRGEDCHLWKGGVTEGNAKIRKSFEMSEWRRKVFERDNYTCRECGIYGKYLEAHHIKSFANHPELRFDVENGLTVCLDCHCKIDKFRKRTKKGG